MITTHTYTFGTLSIHSNFVIAIMNEGITVKPEYNEILVSIANKYYPNKPFGYITHRINSYSVDPSIYIETSKIKNLVAFAVVSEEPLKLSAVDVEKIFLKKPFKTFQDMTNAQEWVNSQCETTL